MSEFTDILGSRIKLKRLTYHIVDKKTISASVVIDRQPQEACRIAVGVDGCTVGTGIISIVGSTTDNLNFSNNGIIVNSKDFTSISSITVSGISGGFIEVKAVSKTGQNMIQEREVYSSLAVRFEALPGKIRMLPSGQKKEAKFRLLVESGMDVKESDIIYAISGVSGLTRGQISFVEDIFDFDGATHHMEAEIIPL